MHGVFLQSSLKDSPERSSRAREHIESCMDLLNRYSKHAKFNIDENMFEAPDWRLKKSPWPDVLETPI